MKIAITGTLDNTILFKRKNYDYSGSRIIKKELDENTKLLNQQLTNITKKYNYKLIENNNTDKTIIVEDNDETIKLYYKYDEIKLYETFFIDFCIEVEFSVVTTNLLLVLNDIFEYLKSKTKSFRRWKITYIGETKNKYLVKDEEIKIYANTIELTYNYTTNKQKQFDEILKQIVNKELKKEDIYRYYLRRKLALKEIENQKNIISKIPFIKGTTLKYKDKKVQWSIEKREYIDYILHPYKLLGLSEIVLKEQKLKVNNRKIESINIYKCVNIKEKRQIKCYTYFVIDVLFKKSIGKNEMQKDERHLRIYVDKEINENEIAEIINNLIKQEKF